MTCEPLAYTGGGRLDLLLAIAISCLAAGGLLLLMTRRRGRAVTVALLLLVCGAAVSITGGTPTGAMAADCPPAANSLPAADPLSPADPQSAANPQSAADPQSAANSLTVSQTSVMDGLAPGIAPVAITGVVINNGADSTDIIAVDVEITGVITHPGAVPGPCDPSDYVLLDARMPVGRTLDPGGSTPFAGASIGFNDKSTNQDACKGATIQLLYTANPN
jgi:hypothetical protein